MVLVPAAVAVGVGAALGQGRGWLALGSTILAAGFAFVASLVRSRDPFPVVLAVVAIGCAAVASAAWRADAEQAHLLPSLAEQEAFVEVCGSVRTVREFSVDVGADRVARRDRVWSTSEPVRMTGDLDDLASGQRVCASGRLETARPGRDEPPALRARRIAVVGRTSWVVSAAADVREAYSRAAQHVLDDEEAGLLLGMTVGDVRLLDDETMEAFRTTGMAHLVAVSGSNVAVILAVVVIAGRLMFPHRRVLRAVLAAPPLVFFAFLTSLEPSVLRATVTAGIALAAATSGRTTEGMRVIALAFIVLVLADPVLLLHPGFQLSFGATLGLVVLGAPLSERLSAVLGGSRLATVVALAIGTTVAAQAAVAPLLAWHFDRVPAVGGVANLLVAPLAPVVMVGGMATLTAASLWSAFAWAPATMHLLLAAILAVARFAEDLPAASMALDVAGGAMVTAALGGLVLRSSRARAASLSVLCAAAGFVGAGVVVRSAPVCDGPGVHALDIGQGTAVLLREQDATVLVDTGPPDGGVVEQLGALGVSHLDALVISHPDADHVGAATEVMEALDVDLLVGPVIIGWGVGAEAVAAAEQRGVELRTVAAGQRLTFGAIELDVLAPRAGPAPRFDEGRANDLSLVLEARLSGMDVVLPGDIGAEVQRRLLASIPQASVLIAPHHGSKDIDARFAPAVAPDVVVVTVGRHNTFGHPAPEALEVYEEAATVVRTDRDGPVSVCGAPGGIEVWT